jgi:hypothetical protein
LEAELSTTTSTAESSFSADLPARCASGAVLSSVPAFTLATTPPAPPENVMYDFDGYAQLSREALNYIGGILAHGRALMAFCAPTTNSYRRLVPGYEAPVNLVYSQRNRSAACRIPVYSASPKAKRVEFRPPDPTATRTWRSPRC